MFDYNSSLTKGFIFDKHEMTARMKIFKWKVPIAYDVRYKIRPELKTCGGIILCLGAVLISAVVTRMEEGRE